MLFFGDGYCNDWEDGRNDANCLHHCLGRVSNSAYNAVPLNNFRNHMPEGRKNLLPINSFNTRYKYLKKTKEYLDNIKYIPNEKDIEFLEKYKHFYN